MEYIMHGIGFEVRMWNLWWRPTAGCAAADIEGETTRRHGNHRLVDVIKTACERSTAEGEAGTMKRVLLQMATLIASATKLAAMKWAAVDG